MMIFDCTLRDGANILGSGFPYDLTKLILDGLTDNNIPIIEMGNAKGLGAYDISHSIAPLRDEEYFELAQPYLNKAQIGMFLNAKRFRENNVKLASQANLSFLRIGADAGDGERSKDVIHCVKENGMKAYYSQMKAYLLTPEELTAEAIFLEENGIDEITIMDSAGVMWPEQVYKYIDSLKKEVSVPIGFHGHNNLYFAAANCKAALEAGADILDGGLLGLARSAGNAPTEVNIAILEKKGIKTGVNFWGLLNFLSDRLIPALEKRGINNYIKPLELVLGFTGCHSSFVPIFNDIAKEINVDIFKLIDTVSQINKKNPDKELIKNVAIQLKDF